MGVGVGGGWVVDVSEVTLIGVSELASTSTIRVFAQWVDSKQRENGGQLSGTGELEFVFLGGGREGWEGMFC